MRTADDSWLVTCEMDLEPEASDLEIWQPLHIRYTTFQQSDAAF